MHVGARHGVLRPNIQDSGAEAAASQQGHGHVAGEASDVGGSSVEAGGGGPHRSEAIDVIVSYIMLIHCRQLYVLSMFCVAFSK